MFDSSQSPSPAVQASDTPRAIKPTATRSLHGDFLEQNSPQWLIGAAPARKQALKDVRARLPTWYQNASPSQQEVVNSSFLASFNAQVQLDRTMASFQDIDHFARPLLVKALKDQYQVEVDVDTTLLCLRRPLAVGLLEVEVSSFEFLKLTLLEAALHNFEAWECKEGAYHKTSGFVAATGTPGTYHSVPVSLKVSQFLTLCRSLDIGAKYQTYLQSFFYPEDGAAQVTLRDQFITAQKTAVRAAAEQALLTGDIEPADHRMILSVIDGEIHPWMGAKQVWFRTLSLMKLRMTGCMAFLICEKYRYPDELILYIPQDPEHPLKRYRWHQMEAELKRLFTARDTSRPDDPAPTPYQVFFSRFVPYDKRPYYFSQFTEKAGDSPTDIWRSPWKKLVDFTTPHFITGIKELPPEAPAKRVPKSDPYLAPSTLQRRGRGIWADNIDPWKYFYEQHREQVIADARAHAVPTDDVDAKARDAKLAHLFELGLLGLNVVSMFVPVLGEAMMVVMAGQLLYETLEGAIEWGEGDLQAAKAHLVDVAENLAQIAVMAGVGAGVSRLRAANATPVIEALSQVTRPDGQTRLWRPNLSRYESPITLERSLSPNALGQYVKEGRTFIRLDSKVYEQSFDGAINKWRIKHPTDVQAYQPILEHNGNGAWHHTLERPLEWDRLTLLRRLGHETETFTDQELLKIGEVSGVSDNTLRKVHMDHSAAPPELQEALRMFKAEADSARVIEQVEGTQLIDDLYLYALPLIVEMPGWPRGRVLEVFKGLVPTGESVKYGATRLPKGVTAKPTIKVSRYDILDGEVPARVLASLDEAEIVRLLGGEGARVPADRALEFTKQLAEYARQRRPAIYQSIYAGTEPRNGNVRLLQAICPGLSDSAAQTVLKHADVEALERLSTTRRVPLKMLEEARWYAREGRQVRAYAGLRSETIASGDSRRLALQALQKLPGWPDDLRLEVHDGSLDGSLLDSIGPDTARQKKYLVKQGPGYQAFDERGEALNSLPKASDNFYASLMHAMPDEARRSLGVPEVSQHVQLQRKIIEQADADRADAIGLLEPNARRFKPPVRVSERLVGYYASGRGSGIGPALAREVRKIYPDLTYEQLNGFVLEQVRAGNDTRAIAIRLRALLQERTQLDSALDQWVSQSSEANRQYNFLAAQALKRSWRRSVLAGKSPGADTLKITLNDPLPALSADFSHVRDLSLSGASLHDATIDGLLRHFPNIESLSIQAPITAVTTPGLELTNVPQALVEMKALKRLTFNLSASRLAAQYASRLAALTGLEHLEIGYWGYQRDVVDSLDLTPLQTLKRLTIVAPHVASMRWPAYVQKLAMLERLDLSRTSISELPMDLYIGHERLWSGLSLDWSQFSHEAFKPAYDYVKHYAGRFGPHLASLDEMVRGYARGELNMLMGGAVAGNRLNYAVMARWNTPETRMGAIELLRIEHAGIFKQFYQWHSIPGFRNRFPVEQWRTGHNARVLQALERNWRGVVCRRYEVETDTDITRFELPDPGLSPIELPQDEPLGQLPILPAGTFSHVKTLKLRWLQGVPSDQVRGFIQAFEGLQTLELRLSGLTEVPIAPGTFSELTQLDLSDNHIVVTPGVQAQINGLKNLQVLSLQNNWLGTLDVSALTQLKALNLRQAELREWPAGAESMTQLACLDLRDNHLVTITPAALEHSDVVMRTDLAGNPLSAEGQASLNAAQRRIEAQKGLPEGALSRFAQDQAPLVFPPAETVVSVAAHLLPLPLDLEGIEGPAGYAARIQRLNPAMTQQQAVQRIEQLRTTGLDDALIDAQIRQWQQDHATLTRELNGWLFIREQQASGVVITSQSRGLAARSIRNNWQSGVVGGSDAEVEGLSLQGLQTGDLPVMTLPFSHVRTLDLTGIRLSALGSNEFLARFTQLQRLVLSGNQLEVLPQAVQHMNKLERLELAANDFRLAPSVPTQMQGEHLRWLDMSHNHLLAFDVGPFSRLQTLELSYNGITQWPDGALEAQHLTTLNLGGNDLISFPSSLLDGTHADLVAGTSLDDNFGMSLECLEQMYQYAHERQLTELMGYPVSELDHAHRRYVGDSDSSTDYDSDPNTDSDDDNSDRHAGYEPAEVIPNPEHHVAPQVLEAWLANTDPQTAPQRTAQWNQLAQEQNHERFFNLISLLRDTSEYKFNRASLTQRVWAVIEAAAENAELRNTLFIEAETHGTCVDGRILTFSEMEVRVFEFRALRDVPMHRLDLRGRVLLDLSRQLFRLSNVDQLAEAAAIGMDRAEVRLSYRIGLTRGWPDGLELPGQPAYMAFDSPLEGEPLAQTRAQILALESTDSFIETLIVRDYWNRYLQARYVEQFQALEDELANRYEALEDEYSDRGDAQSMQRYNEALGQLEVERSAARTQKRMQLSRTEVQRLAGISLEPPRAPSPQPGPSWRP